MCLAPVTIVHRQLRANSDERLVNRHDSLTLDCIKTFLAGFATIRHDMSSVQYLIYGRRPGGSNPIGLATGASGDIPATGHYDNGENNERHTPR